MDIRGNWMLFSQAECSLAPDLIWQEIPLVEAVELGQRLLDEVKRLQRNAESTTNVHLNLYASAEGRVIDCRAFELYELARVIGTSLCEVR